MALTHTDQFRVLIADDNAWMQRILAKILISYGLKPLIAANAYETLALAIELRPQAIILDIVMPEINGLQTLRFLKTISMTREIPVLVITAAAEPENLGQALSLGAAGFIRKPFTRVSIHEKLCAVFGNDVLPDANSVMTRVSDDELEAIMNSTRKDDHLTKSIRSQNRRSNLSVGQPKPIAPSQRNDDDVAPTPLAKPELTGQHRRSRMPLRRGTTELPDQETIREILKRSKR